MVNWLTGYVGYAGPWRDWRRCGFSGMLSTWQLSVVQFFFWVNLNSDLPFAFGKCSFLRLLKGASEQLTRKSITATLGMQMIFQISTDNTMPFKFRSGALSLHVAFAIWANCGFCSNAAAPARNVAAPPESSAEVDDLERRLASLRRIWVWAAKEGTCL